MNVVLKGVVGSTAYGLATKNSDVDYLGVYAEHSSVFWGLYPPFESKDATHVSSDPDCTMHEVLKFAKLALKSNPTVNELMWLPKDCYVESSPAGEYLIKIRESFLCKRHVRSAYLGYAFAQFKELDRRGGTFGPDLARRTEKHARHLLRLCQQGLDLWTTGHMNVRVPDPERFMEFGRIVAAGDIEHAKVTLAEFDAQFDSTSTVLPEEPAASTVDRWVQDTRKFYSDKMFLETS